MRSLRSSVSAGFTLVEMLVVAPIIILAIGAFIALIINLTGEVMSSRGANIITYNLQDALNRIEEDVKLSAGFLATNNIALSSSNPQGRGGVNSTTNFTLTDGTHGKALILNAYATNGNPISIDSGLIYLANKPSNCTSFAEYSKNRPMTTNIVYFIDTAGTLWRRVIMPADYANSSTYCGSDAPWQQPTCIANPARHAFCKTNDEKLLDNVGTGGFDVQYYTQASSSSPLAISGATTTADLQAVTTVSINLEATSTIAGRAISKSGSLRVSRLDTNASAVGDLHAPTGAPAAPMLSSAVTGGRVTTFTWPQVATASSYSLRHRINGGSWSTTTSTTNESRSYTVGSGWNGDVVEAQITAVNDAGSAASTLSTTIPVWTPLDLQNGWLSYGDVYGPPAFTKTRTGLILFRGMIRHPSYGSGEVVIGKIPTDYAPTEGDLIFSISRGSNVSGRIDIRPNGDVLLVEGSSAWTSLETIRYDRPSTAVVPYTRTAATLLNSWTNYGGAYAPASYAQDPVSKRVIVQGLVRSGSTSTDTPLFTLPAALRTATYIHAPSRSNTGWSVSGNNNSGSVIIRSGGNGYLTINSIFYPDTAVTWTNASLVNGWVNYGGSWATASFTRSENETATGSTGVVSLRGLIRSGSTSYDSTLFTLPVGYRPKYRILSTTVDAGIFARIDILPSGEVRFMGSTNGYYSLDNITFLAEQ